MIDASGHLQMMFPNGGTFYSQTLGENIGAAVVAGRVISTNQI